MIFVNRFSVHRILHSGNRSSKKIHLLPIYCKTKNDAPNTQHKFKFIKGFRSMFPFYTLLKISGFNMVILSLLFPVTIIPT